MVWDMLGDSEILQGGWQSVCLALPIFLSSAINPWVYGIRNTEIRAAVHKILQKVLGKMGVQPSNGE